MDTGRNPCWRMAAIAVVCGCAIAGGWYVVRYTTPRNNQPLVETVKSTPAAAPAASTDTPEAPSAVVQAGALIPAAAEVPLPPAAPIPVPAVVPAPLPLPTAEPPLATPLPPPSGLEPGELVIPQPPGLAPPLQPAGPVQPLSPANPDSDLNPNVIGHTLKSGETPSAPLPPIGGSMAPAAGGDRAKPSDPHFGPTDKYVYPLPAIPETQVPQPRDDTMLKLTTTAAFAVFGGALLAAENANSFPSGMPAAPTLPGMLTKADPPTPTETDKLKEDLRKANEKIEKLEQQVKRLTELLTGKKDELGLPADPTNPGAVEEVKELKNKIAALEAEVKTLRTQTVLKPGLDKPIAKAMGVVRVVNDYPVEISIAINEKSYRVAPGTKVEVEVPVGEFTYQLLHSGAAATRSVIQEKEPVTLRIK